jgi:hypothetical protein
MAIAALSNFTVPLASDQSASSQGMLMPKLKYRFRITFENFGASGSTTELTKQVSEAARPQVKFTDQKIDIYNSVIHFAGKPSWEPISVKLRDDVTGAVSKLVGEQNQKQFDFFEQASATAGGDYKFVTRIEMLDGGNGNDGGAQTLETWALYGCYLASTSYESLSYTGAADPMMIKLSIQYDNAQQEGIGSAMGTQGFIQQRGTSTTGNGLY